MYPTFGAVVVTLPSPRGMAVADTGVPFQVTTPEPLVVGIVPDELDPEADAPLPQALSARADAHTNDVKTFTRINNQCTT